MGILPAMVAAVADPVSAEVAMRAASKASMSVFMTRPFSCKISSAGLVVSGETARTASDRSSSSVTRERERARYSQSGSHAL